MSATVSLAEERPLDEPHWVARAAFPFLIVSFLLTQFALDAAVYYRITWLCVVLMLLSAHLMHGFLIAFHEASHGLLRNNRLINDIDGVIAGMFSFMSFTLYRAAHQTHHMHLGTEKDEELWPFVNPRISRGWRMFAAFVELNCGLFFTPFLFFRSFLRKGSPIRSPKVRRRIWNEVILMVVVWSLIIGAVAWFGAWRYFLWVYAMPAFIAGNLQSWRKYIEHVGLTGSTERSATRSIIPSSVAGRVFSFTLLHEPFHGVHHLHTGLSHAELPLRADSLYPTHPDEHDPFPNYRTALWHLLRSLRDPQVGAQWRAKSAVEVA